MSSQNFKMYLLFIFLFILNSAHRAQEINDLLLSNAGQWPSIAIDKNSNIHVAWSVISDGIYYALFDLNWSELKEPYKISNLGYSLNPAIAVNHLAVAGWLEMDAHSGYVIGQTVSLEGQPVSDKIVFDSNYAGGISSPGISFVTDSTLVFVWSNDDGICGQLTTDSLQFLGGKKVLALETRNHENFHWARISCNLENTNMMVVWRSELLSDRQIMGRVFTKYFVPVDSSFVISELEDVTECWIPEVVTKSNGDFAVIFQAEINDSIWNVYYRLYNQLGHPLSECRKINESIYTHWPYLKIAIDNNDRMIVVWDDYFPEVSSKSIIVGQRIASDNSLISNNFQISHLPEGASHYWQSVAIREGYFYTAWNAFQDTHHTLWANVIDFENPTTSVNNMPLITEQCFILDNYPNPFNISTTIKFQIPETQYVSLKIYNMLGQEVVTLVNETLPPDEYEITWNAKDLPSSIYLVKLKAGDIVETRKAVLQR
jgi:hypothetical protein